ncbi:NUDIX domain-containing protein [Varibaculum cambriense]|uniref:NUDIX domain-containing protein n=1 Tax=Varibaculum cambriense TaxID=184870 RepID=UPI00255378D6|nr:NUDIX hydrolase [Varibaculum cambriense]MDK8275204.1 NUDIX hydrolase [Varibaculum cambriense]
MELRDENFSFPVEDHQLIYQGKVFDFVTDSVRLHADEPAAQRDYLAHPGAVAIAAVRPIPGADPTSRSISDWEILLVRQYRHPVRAFLWEVPAGLLDHAGEDRLEAAQRELWEEANLQAKTWQVLVDFFTSPGGTSEHLRVFLARDISVATGERFEAAEEERDMETAWFTLEQARNALFAGSLHNPSAMASILAAIAALRQGWEGLREADAPFTPDPLKNEI